MQIDSAHPRVLGQIGHVGETPKPPSGAAAPSEVVPPPPQDRMEASSGAHPSAEAPSLPEYMHSIPMPQFEAPPIQEQAPDAVQAALSEYRMSPVRPGVNLEKAAGGGLLMFEGDPMAPAPAADALPGQEPLQGIGGVTGEKAGLGEKLKFWKWGIWERLQAAFGGDSSSSGSGGKEPDVALAGAAFDAYTARAALDPMVQGLLDPDATVVKSKNLGSGINASHKVTLSNGLEALWKPTRGEDMSSLRNQCEEDHQGRREAATYIVDRWMNHFTGVPPVVYRELGGEKGTLMLWVKDAQVAMDMETKAAGILKDTKGESYQRMAVLDNVIGNLDRHDGNWMIDSGGQAVPIDHGLCFPLKNSRQGYINYDFEQKVTLTPGATAGLQNLVDHREEVKQELIQLIDPKAVDAMFVRVEKMLKLGTTDDSWR